MTSLPLVDAHAREHTYCAYCPKLCRFACPVSTVQARETTTPWGKMTSLHHVANGRLPLGREHASTWWACTGCMRCKTFCDHGNEVAQALGAGRAEALAAGEAPPEARAAADAHAGREARARDAARRLFGERIGARTATAFVPGCTSCVVAPADTRAAHALVDGLTDGAARVEASSCCGLPLLDAGDREGFVKAARRFVDRLRDTDTAVFHDPGCLHAIARIAPALGVSHAVRLEHVSQLAARRLEHLGPATVPGPVRYHDACRLGRGMGVYDEPRAVLAHVTGQPPLELDQRRDRAECSGAGGQLPRTDRGTADAIGRERSEDHDRAGGGPLVTACPASRRALARAGIDAVDFSALVSRALPGWRP